MINRNPSDRKTQCACVQIDVLSALFFDVLSALFFMFLSVYYDVLYSTVFGCLIRVYILVY